jgi:hypothetical protein
MHANANAIDCGAPLTALMRTTAAATVDAVLAMLGRLPSERLSLQDAVPRIGRSEQQFRDFVKRGVAPKSVLFGRDTQRFKSSEVGAQPASGGASSYSSKGDPGAVRR